MKLTQGPIIQGKSPKTEPVAKGVSVGHVSRIGHPPAPGAKVGPLYEGRGYSPPRGPTGNLDARPGGNNRQVFKAGSQSATPQARPMPAGRNIDSERPNKK